MGQQRIVKRDRLEDDFRPGLPFDAVWSVFERADGAATEKFVGHVEQMHESRCYRASAEALGCISCHDPHRRPGADERAGYYRERCLECHGADRGCSLPEPSRRARNRNDDCTACHMPRLGESDIPHVAATDHRVLREPDAADRPAADQRPADRPLVPFRRDGKDDRRRAETDRDLGVALSRLGTSSDALALSLLDRAVNQHPDDLAAWQAKGLVLGRLGEPARGLAAYREALDRQPDFESARAGAAELEASLGKLDQAIADWRRAIALDPSRAAYRANLAAVCFESGDWRGAIAAGREALRLDPADLESRERLVAALLRAGDREAAREELRALLAFNPPDRDALMRRFPDLAPVPDPVSPRPSR